MDNKASIEENITDITTCIDKVTNEDNTIVDIIEIIKANILLKIRLHISF